jgi:hypothetical protein
MAIHLEKRYLVDSQQMEIRVNGPDGATHLVLCTGVAELGRVSHKTFAFLVGPELSRRQFVGAIVSGALASLRAKEIDTAEKHDHGGLAANLVSIQAGYDEETRQVRVTVEVSAQGGLTDIAISYHVSILAELSGF